MPSLLDNPIVAIFLGLFTGLASVFGAFLSAISAALGA